MSKLKKAMEKAKAARESDSDPVFIQKTAESTPGPRPRATGVKTDTDQLLVSYSQTRVRPIDRKILKNNRIISLFYDSAVTDQLKIIRTQVLDRLSAIGGNSLLVTSAHPGEGKTFMSINLGVSIAQELDRTVLVVDTDLRHPWKRHQTFDRDFFGLDLDKGMSDYLMGQAEIQDLLLNPGIEKLTILPGGRPVENSSELLGAPRMKALVRELKDRYAQDRIIIFDSASLLTCADALVFSDPIDGVLLVVEAEKTSPSDLKRVMELLKERTVVGTVLNKTK